MSLHPQTVEEQAAFFHDHGYVVIENAVSAAYLRQLQEATEPLLRESENGVVRNLLALSPLYEDLIDGHAGFPVIERLIGDDIQLLSFDLRACLPGSGSLAWHVDLEPSRPFFSSSVISIDAALYLDDLTPENGALRLLPRSHKVPFSLRPEERYAELPGEIVVECKAGTMVAFSDGLWHRTGDNRTPNARRGLFIYYGHFWQKPCAWAESPTPFHRMRQYIDGKGPRRAQLLGLFRQGSEYNTFEYYLPPDAQKAEG
ncbi:MAG TPA: phytanoyl-CoA dioxygenase family protein [Chthonomonadaceae bacterium]|nr:phytanoyl-CoA dioxygenase family protein [Chthonomonadaceae bacterium]